MFWVGLVITILVWIFMGIGGAFYYIIFILITRGFVSVTRKLKQKIDIDLCQGETTEETEGTTEKDHSMLDDFYSAFCLLWAGIEVLWNHYRMHYSADSVNRFIPQTADCPAYGKFPCQPAFK